MINKNVRTVIKSLEAALNKLRNSSVSVVTQNKHLDEMDKQFILSSHETLLNYLNLTEEDVDYMMTLNLTFTNSSSVDTLAACYCSGGIRDLAKSYRSVHGYVSLIVCAFGTIANLLNVIVLTRKELCSVPINRILTGIAIADMLVMLEYVPFACYMYLRPSILSEFTYTGAVFILFHTHFSQVLHTISICLTLTLAIWRYVAIRYPQQSHILCSEQRCQQALSAAFLLPLLICAPSYLNFSIRSTKVLEKSGVVVLYHIDLSQVAKEDDGLLYIVNLWVYAVLIKIFPCLLLTVISYWLINVLYRVNRKKQELKSNTFNMTGAGAEASGGKPKLDRAGKRIDRTTRMLVAVLLLFLITEFPQGILGLLSGILGRCFFKNCYHLFGEIMDILALLNGAINFILYCSMSRQFRTTFNQLFKPKLLRKWAPSHTEVQTTFV
ncbi:sex peptide receptor isoform X1 [Nilaparvata lugens]|uniref:sex peptide receptor isoform X1 n=1 Tax=Nilaparvata lugens TaxID=108931 RepID=UPI00193E39A5|nr:sex peptide receptor isoform X1 [Nilaparvata lugens]XP_039277184.1 sex peptide receptor isoform X1 [Nilaparvata lugens]XP_039277185.1 sex peptide receptor isoform X1 [Nilaparvata lugens]XP_039277186.1 sex peptide receptor isoform X1 [Nilaparvata lugens]